MSNPMASPSDQPDWAAEQMSPAAREYFKAFLAKYQSFRQEVEKTSLVILVWGPGPSENDLYQKRLQIRGLLRQKGDAAVFSEEVDDECKDFRASAKMRELLQALSADFVMILQSSAGSIAEVHDFAGFIRDLGSKMFIFIDSRHVSGYSYTGALQELKTLYNNVQTYEYPKDIHECHLIAAVEERLRILRWAKWRAGLQ